MDWSVGRDGMQSRCACCCGRATLARNRPAHTLPRPAPPAHLYLRRGSGRNRLFIELARSTRTRTGTSESKAARGSGGGPRFHTTSTSPTEGQAL